MITPNSTNFSFSRLTGEGGAKRWMRAGLKLLNNIYPHLPFGHLLPPVGEANTRKTGALPHDK